jgi:nucleoside-diphosphate-sugar epimerase
MLTNSETQRQASVLILGAGGFLGSAVIDAGVAAGLTTLGVVRQPAAARRIADRGGVAVVGDATNPESWISQAANAVAVIDLIQPKIPQRLGKRALERIVAERVKTTRAVVDALESLPADRRPLYVSVSGVAELVADTRGLISHESTLTSHPAGFAKIGLGARAVVRESGIDAAYVHLGTVFGPGKSFTERILPALERGRYPIFGRGENRIALVHVDDAARALVHIATLPRAETRRQSWIVVDQSTLTLGAFLTRTAAAVGGPRPRHMPRWVGRALLGSGIMAELSKHVPSDSSRLAASGFTFQFPRFDEGLAATLAALGHASRSTEKHETKRTTSTGVRT